MKRYRAVSLRQLSFLFFCIVYCYEVVPKTANSSRRNAQRKTTQLNWAGNRTRVESGWVEFSAVYWALLYFYLLFLLLLFIFISSSSRVKSSKQMWHGVSCRHQKVYPSVEITNGRLRSFDIFTLWRIFPMSACYIYKLSNAAKQMETNDLHALPRRI